MEDNMSKLTKSALALVLAGLLICAACAAFAGFDFSDLSTSAPPTAQHFEFDAANAGIESIRISLSTDDLTIVESDDGHIHVKLYTYDYEEAKAEVEDGVLGISKERKGFKSWFNINLNFGDYTNVVSLPKGVQCDISASLSTGGVTIEDIESLGRVSVTQSTGDTKIYNTNAKSMTVSCSTGGIKVENANISGDAAFTTKRLGGRRADAQLFDRHDDA